MALWDKLSKMAGSRSVVPETREAAIGSAANAFVFGDSEEAGVRERHLQRRRGNPLFPPERRQVTIDELAEARVADMADAAEFEQEFMNSLVELRAMASSPTWGWFQDAARRIDELIDRATAIGGRALVRRADLECLFEKIVTDMRPALEAHSPENLAALDRANAFRAAWYSRPAFAFGEQISSLPRTEQIPALLSEPPAVITSVLESVGEETQALIRSEAAQLLLAVTKQGHQIPDLGQIVAALGLPPGPER